MCHILQLEAHVKNWLKATLSKYDDTDTKTPTPKTSTNSSNTHQPPAPRRTNAMKEAWDGVMKKYTCCGLDSDVNDFIQSGWYRLVIQHFWKTLFPAHFYSNSNKATRVPPMCCRMLGNDVYPDPCLESNRNKEVVNECDSTPNLHN